MLKLNQIIYADCMNEENGLPSLRDNFFDFTFTSPPYKDDEVPIEYYEWFQSVLKELKRVTRISILIFNSSTRLIEISKRFNPTRILIWNKHNGFLKYSYRYEPIFLFHLDESLKINKRIYTDVFNFTPIREWNTPYENPVKLYISILKMLVKEKNPIILDPFIGSGTTAEACIKLGFSYLGFEMEDFQAIHQKRLKFLKKLPLQKQLKI